MSPLTRFSAVAILYSPQAYGDRSKLERLRDCDHEACAYAENRSTSTTVVCWSASIRRTASSPTCSTRTVPVLHHIYPTLCIFHSGPWGVCVPHTGSVPINRSTHSARFRQLFSRSHSQPSMMTSGESCPNSGPPICPHLTRSLLRVRFHSVAGFTFITVKPRGDSRLEA